METVKYKRLEVMRPRIKNKSELLVGTINHPGSVHGKFYRRDWLIQSIIYLWRIFRGGEGGEGGGLIERGAY